MVFLYFFLLPFISAAYPLLTSPIFTDIGNYFYVYFEAGSNKDLIKSSMDTGSWLTHILDTRNKCTGNCATQSKRFGVYDYNGLNSTTRVDLKKTAGSNFGDSYFYKGESVTDDIYFNGLKAGNLNFDDVTDSGAFYSALLGLAKPPSGEETENIASAAKRAGTAPKAAYSFNLQNLNDTDGQLIIGGIDHGRLDSEVTWTSIANKNIGATLGYISINGTKIEVGNKFMNLDSGTWNGELPTAIYNQFYDALPHDPAHAKGSNQISCALVENKTITYNLNGVDYELPLKAIVWPNESGSTCNLAVREGNSPHIGAYVFRYLTVAVNFDNSTLGLASTKAVHSAPDIREI